MHHMYHDDPEWHRDPDRDEIDSVISNNYNKMLEKEFQGQDRFRQNKKKNRSGEPDFNQPNLFTGKFSQYKD